MKKVIWITLLWITAWTAQASGWAGTVTEIKATAGTSTILFSLSEPLDSPLRCNDLKMYAIDLAKPGGQLLFELLKLAYSEGREVYAESLNTCTYSPSAENVKSLVIR